MKFAATIRLSVVIAGCSTLGLAAQRPSPPIPSQELQRANIKALQRAIEDLAANFGDRYPRGKEFLKQAADYEKEASAIETALQTGDAKTRSAGLASALATKIEALRREALLANPLLDFDKLLLVRRRENQMGLPQNWQGDCSLARHRLRQPDCRPLAGPPGRQGHHALSARESAFVGDVESALRRRKDALLDAQCQRPLADL